MFAVHPNKGKADSNNSNGKKAPNSIGMGALRAVHTFELLARQIMGKKEFIGIGLFFLSLLQQCEKYLQEKEDFVLVFITRRCHVLFQMYLEYFEAVQKALGSLTKTGPLAPGALGPFLFPSLILDAKLTLQSFGSFNLNAIKPYCITDNNLISLAPALRGYFDSNLDFPQIMVADELLIHGRAFNAFLSKLEENVLSQEDEDDPVWDREWMRSRLERRITPWVYAENDGVLFLFRRYMKRMKAEKVCDKNTWRDISAKFARLIMTSAINNVSYSWSLRVPSWDMSRNFSKNVFEGGSYAPFQHYVTNLQNVSQDTFIYLYPNEYDVRAICTIRTKESILPLISGKTGFAKTSRQFAPFITLDRVPPANHQALHEQIVHDISLDHGLEEAAELLTRGSGYRVGKITETNYLWIAETNELILEYLLFRKFSDTVFAGTKWNIGRFARYVDFEPLSRNYSWIKTDSLVDVEWEFTDAEPGLKALWSWAPPEDQLERYLDILLEGVPSVWDGDVFTCLSPHRRGLQKIPDVAPVSLAVQDAIAEIGYEAEQNAYELFSGGVSLSERSLANWGDQYSITDILRKCDRELDGYSPYYRETVCETDLYQVVALLIQSMDIGFIGMTPLLGEESRWSNSDDQLFTMVKAGEQALFIWPTRYRVFLPVLEAIEKRWPDRMGTRIALSRLAAEYCDEYSELNWNPSKLAKDLEKLLMKFRLTGQKLSEWNIPLYDFPGISPQGQRQGTVPRILEDMERQWKCREIFKEL